MPSILITAGATKNPLDAIRYISAHSSGRTGVSLAEALSKKSTVTLLGSTEACLRAPNSLDTIEFSSTRDLMAKMQHWVSANPNGVVVHASAVGDYEADASDKKIPSGKEELILRLRPTPKIIDHILQWSPSVTLASFKAAPPGTSDEALISIASKQRTRTGSAIVFANVIGRLQSRILILQENQHQWFESRDDALQQLQLWAAAEAAKLDKD